VKNENLESTPEKDAIPNSVTEASLSISESLFGNDFAMSDEPQGTPAAPPVQEETTETVPEQTETIEAAPTDADSEYLNNADLAKKMVKLTVNGKDMDVTYEQLVRSYQTDTYLTQKGQRIAEEAKTVETKPAPLLTPPTPMEIDDDYYKEFVAPAVTAQNQELQGMKAQMEQMASVLQPVQYQNNVDRMAQTMASKGYDDFKAHLPKIEEHIMSLPPEQQALMDTQVGYENIFLDMKNKELMAAKSVVPTPRPVEVRKAPNVAVEQSSGVASKADNSSATYNAAFKKACETQSRADWLEVTRLKGAMGVG